MSERVVGQTKDVGFEIGVSKTVPHPVDVVWRYLVGPGVRVWLGDGAQLGTERGAAYRTGDGTTGEVRSYRERDRVRLTWRPASWDHDTTLQVALSPIGNRTVLRFHQEWLADAAERERQREHWQRVIGEISEELDAAS